MTTWRLDNDEANIVYGILVFFLFICIDNDLWKINGKYIYSRVGTEEKKKHVDIYTVNIPYILHAWCTIAFPDNPFRWFTTTWMIYWVNCDWPNFIFVDYFNSKLSNDLFPLHSLRIEKCTHWLPSVCMCSFFVLLKIVSCLNAYRYLNSMSW